jgi:hypothetical protein
VRQLDPGGEATDRAAAAAAIIIAVDRALGLGDAALVAAFERRDALRGALAAFTSPSVRPGPIEGLVVGIDPLHGLGVRPAGESAVLWLPAATTSVIAPAGSGGPAPGQRGARERTI